MVVHTRAIFEGVNKAGDVVWGDGNDEGVGDDCQHADTFENPMPDTWQPNQRRMNICHHFIKGRVMNKNRRFGTKSMAKFQKCDNATET